MSPMLRALLHQFEAGPRGGFADRPYRCPAGYLTVGWGHRLLVKDNLRFPLTEADANALLESDVAKFADRVDALVNVPLTPGQRDALISFALNLGAGALARSTLLKKLNSYDYAGAALEFERWNKVRNPQTGKMEPLAGLTRRRKAERQLFDGAASALSV